VSDQRPSGKGFWTVAKGHTAILPLGRCDTVRYGATELRGAHTPPTGSFALHYVAHVASHAAWLGDQ
jgi:hypothetical protein